MTTTAGSATPTVIAGAAPAAAGSLAAELNAGAHPVSLLFPGIDASWPTVLAEALVGRPDLRAWVDTVVADLDAWACEPRVRALGLFADGFAPLLPGEAATDTAPDPRAATGPFALVGSLLTNLVSLAGLAGEGLHVGPTTRSAGHSAGLLAAVVATARDTDGLVPVQVAADAARIAAIMGAHAARHPWSVSDSAVAEALAGAESAGTPMVALAGPRTSRLAEILDSLGAQDRVTISVINGRTRHVLAGDPQALQHVHAALAGLAQAEATKRSAGQLGGSPFRFAWEPIASSVPFHHPDLSGAAQAALAQIGDLGLTLPDIGDSRITDPATGGDLPRQDTLPAVVWSVLARAHNWAAAVVDTVPIGTVAVLVSPLGAMAGVSASRLRGRGALLIDPSTPAGRAALFTPGSAPAIPETYARFAPRAVHAADGSLRLANLHTQLSGRSPMILPGMTPSTVEAPIVVAAANGGHIAELAGGGQVTERIFTERIAEIREGLAPGQEVVLNALHLDPYLWNLQVGRERLVQRARAAGAPINGVTISAGIPDKVEALELLDELAEAGIWLNAFKPGTVAQVQEVLAIANETTHTIWMHLEGGTAGGHHSWEDLDELLLSTYHLIRAHDNVVLAVGGGVADPQRATALLTGAWAHPHGAATMPVDAILLGTVTMAARESAASDSVKAALADAAGHSGWVGRGKVAGGTTSGRSGLNADIHFLDNSASRTAALLDSVAGDAKAVAAQRPQIIEALDATAKPYFGDVADMTYAQLLQRFITLTALGGHGRYEDGRWLDSTHRVRFQALLQQAEARLHPTDEGSVPTLFAELGTLDDPDAALRRLIDAHPAATTALLHPADVAHFLTVARMPGKPVPFVPVIDADVRRWYQSDSLWQSHSDIYDADQVLIIPGPVAVSGITTTDEPVADLLDRFESTVAETLVASDRQNGGAPATTDFRLARTTQRPGSAAEALLAAALSSRTWVWLASHRPNPLHRIGDQNRWTILGETAMWSAEPGENATLAVTDDESLVLTLHWPDLGLPGDGQLQLGIDVVRHAGVITFVVTEQALRTAGGALLTMFGGGTAAPTAPAELAAAHAATVGAAGALPDRTMTTLWPAIFGALADADLAPAVFDLVHLSHEIDLAEIGAGESLPAGQPRAGQPEVTRTEGGLVVTVASGTGTAHVVDRFFVRRSHVDLTLPLASARPQRSDVVATPVRTLGTLTVTAPIRLEAFATVSGDANPIHRSDLLARFVGLPGRIVHGMWTSAAATRAVLENVAAGNPERLREWQMDFVAPVLPGQEVTFTVTRTGMRAGASVVAVEAATPDGVVAMGSGVVAGPRTMYVFPGQGIQSQGMGMDGYARSSAARATWDRADAATRERFGFSILEIVRQNPQSVDASGITYRHPAGVLHLTQFTQVAMATLALATVAELRAAGVFDPTAAVAGHSVGEYNALGASNGVLPLESAIELVYARGLGMHGLVRRDAEGRSEYGLAVIRPHLAGLNHAAAEHLVAAVANDSGELCEIVNHNLRGKQYAVAGTLSALAELERRLGTGQPGRPPILMVPGIDVPFHSSALRDGVADFRTQLLDKLPRNLDAEGLIGRYIPNLYPHVFELDRQYVEGVYEASGSPVLAEVLADWESASLDRSGLARTLIVELLAWQFASPVRWIETFELMCTPRQDCGLDIERIVEIGVGSAPTLANLAKGSLALGTHRGTRPQVLNVEVDAEAVFHNDEDPAVVTPEESADLTSAEQTQPVPPAPMPGARAAAPTTPAAADLPVDHESAVAALLALRVGVRVEQLEHDSIESLVDGASSRRNQVLMDIGKEFAVSAIDGAHEVPLVELTRTLAERSAGYRYPGPVLSAAVEGAVTAALGPRGSSASALAKRVSSYWGLGAGWVARTTLVLALGTREGTSRRGGDLGTLTESSAEELIDAAVLAAAAQAGVAVAPVTATSEGGGTVDAAAVNELREHVEGILVDQASGVLARLGRVPVADPLDADYREALATLALLEAEHGPAALVAPSFDARRHVLLDSASTWARADVDHLVQAALAAEVASGAGSAADPDGLAELVGQLAAHRDHDPRLRTALDYHRARLAAAGRTATVEVLDRALTAQPVGVELPEAGKLRAALGTGDAARVLSAAEALAERPGNFAGEVALVTGASPNSIAWAALAHLLRGGACVVVVTTSDTPERIAAYRDLERRYAAPGAQLHIVRANLASFADIDALVEWLVTPTVEEVGPVTREVKPALWPTLVLPFAAAPAMGELPDTGREAELTLRLLLLGVQRLVGSLAERAAAQHKARFSVLLPMSPNHGTFGGDGAYGEAKAALATLANKWRSEGSRWGAQTRMIAAEIGWVRGTGLMAGNDPVARYVEDKLGVLTYSAEQMGALIAALATEEFQAEADRAPLNVDLSGGLAGRDDLAAALAAAVSELGRGEPAAKPDPAPTVPALPNLPEDLLTARSSVAAPQTRSRARVRAEDMIVMVGIAEYGPWGASATRWQAETDGLTASGVIELAWRCGLIDWDSSAGTWVDGETAAAVAEAEVAERYREQVQARCGVRLLEDDELVAASGYLEYTEVFLDRAMAKALPSEAEARAMAAHTPGASVTQAEDGWLLTLPQGAPVRIPRRRALLRSAGGQFPTGSDPVRVGLDSGVAGSMDHLTAWNVAITAEALSDAGVTPEELVGAVHPSLVGNTQGSGMGGMDSISTVFMGPVTGRQSANDVLQEALSNVVAAHVNQGLVGGYGPMVHPVAACATAAVSLEEAVDKIALGKAEIIIGGGWDDLSTEGITGFANMAATADNGALIESGLTPSQHSRPGDRRRRGFVESQGGGSFVVCRGSVALALGLPVRAVVGYAASFGDGVHTSIPAPGLGALGAVRGGTDSPLGRALADLGIEPDEVAVVSKHDTSTEANDPNEAFVHETIQQVLGRTPGAPLRVISQKSLTGHAKGGAAAWQMAGLCDVFRTGTVPGNKNLTSADPRVTPGDALVVDYRPLHRTEPVRAALATSLGFGHVSAVVALAHPDVFVEAIDDERRGEYVQRAQDRRVAAARDDLAARHGGRPLMARRTDRRLGSGSPEVLRAREAAMLVDSAGTLPGLGVL